MKRFEVNDAWLDNAPKKELDKFLIAFNDGQGDHSAYTYDEALDLLTLSGGRGQERDVKDFTPSQVFEKFFEELNLSGNNSDTYYFNTASGKYVVVDWA